MVVLVFIILLIWWGGPGADTPLYQLDNQCLACIVRWHIWPKRELFLGIAGGACILFYPHAVRTNYHAERHYACH